MDLIYMQILKAIISNLKKIDNVDLKFEIFFNIPLENFSTYLEYGDIGLILVQSLTKIVCYLKYLK